MSTNFQLTPEHRFYVNAQGDRCEAALLNGAWVAVWDNGNITRHSGDGRCTFSRLYANHSLIEDHHITAEFTGWLSNPFEGAPEWAQFAASNPRGRIVLFADEPDKLLFGEYSGYLSVGAKGREVTNRKGLYAGDWRNSLTHRSDWE